MLHVFYSAEAVSPWTIQFLRMKTRSPFGLPAALCSSPSSRTSTATAQGRRQSLQQRWQDKGETSAQMHVQGTHKKGRQAKDESNIQSLHGRRVRLTDASENGGEDALTEHLESPKCIPQPKGCPPAVRMKVRLNSLAVKGYWLNHYFSLPYRLQTITGLWPLQCTP